MHRITKMGLLPATAIVLALPGSVALADEGCWYHIINYSAQTWHYDISDGDRNSIESGSILPGQDSNYDVWEQGISGHVEYVEVWVESPPAATGNAVDAAAIDFNELFYIDVTEPESCEARMSRVVVDDSGRTRVTIRGGQLELID